MSELTNKPMYNDLMVSFKIYYVRLLVLQLLFLLLLYAYLG